MTPRVFRFVIVSATAILLAPFSRGDFRGELRPILDQHCAKCHGEKKQKGGVDLSAYTTEEAVLKQHKLWRNVLEQIQNGDMPPDDEPALPAADRDKLLQGIQQTLALLETDHPSLRDAGPGILRRLSRAEYSNTIQDLLGIGFDAREAGMPEDNTGTGYSNLATALTVAPELIEKYFTAADSISERLSAASNPMPKELSGARKEQFKKDKIAVDTLFKDLPGEQTEHDAAKTWITKLLRRAYRRPVEQVETEKLLRLFDSAKARGDSFQIAAIRMLKPALVSPQFLFRIETDPSPGSMESHRVSDVELASRLSYFLWSTMPDEELLSLAERNELSKPAIIEAQVRRMLADPKAKALTENFASHWLQLDHLVNARPSTEFFPTFNDQMKRAMREETVMFVDGIREEDRSVLEFLNAGYTYVNDSLAKHYGLAPVTGKELRRVDLNPDNHRGGLLGMGSILALTSHTSRTSPTQRGKWVLEVIFGTPPSPPPADAGMFKDEKKTKEPKDFREKLAQHASDATCAGCHKRIDPLGFGLENYNAVGEWRPSSESLDASGQLPSGEKFNGAAELKQIIWKRRDQFERNLISQMLTYAIGRQLDYYDVNQVAKIKAALDAQGHKFSTLVLGVVNSFPFQNRRSADTAPAKATAAN